MREDAILSFTSHARRLPLVDEVFRSHVANAEAAGMRVCLALQEDSVPAMTPYQRSLVDSGKIELLTIEKDHGSNTKWTLCRAKYPDATMVVVDDDRTYTDEALRELLYFHRMFPREFLCRAMRQLVWRDGRLRRYHLSKREPDRATLYTSLSVPAPTILRPGDIVIEHWAGCLYPPGFPSPSAAAAEAAALAPHDDDAFTTVLLARAGMSAVLVPTSTKLYETNLAAGDPRIHQTSLGRENRDCGWTRTDAVLRACEDDLALTGRDNVGQV